MRRLSTFTILWLLAATYAYSQVRANYQYNTAMPYGTLDLRTRVSSSEYYYLHENKTYSFRERSPGVRTNTYLDMTNWDSSPYKEGHLRHKKGTADDFVMNYRLLFPNGYRSTYPEGYPMIVHLHGAYERANCLYDNCYHSDWDYTVQENSPPAPTSATHKLLNNDDNLSVGGEHYLGARNLAGTRLPDDPSMPDRAFPGFVLAPQMMNSWDSLQVEDVVRIVRLLSAKYNIDPDRIYIQGLSIGGYGIYEAMKRASWLFAAALPMSAVWDANIFTQNQQARVAHMPIWVFQGGNDPRPTPAFTEAIISKLEKAGSVVRYSLYDDLGHTVWWRAYNQRDYYTWMLKQSKANLHAFAGKTVIDKSRSQFPKLMLAEGFLAYQWEKDGAILGHTANTLTVTTPGKYRARFSRKSTSPSGTQWNRWSQYVTITETGSPAPTPTVKISITSPDDGQSFIAPASINFTATASVSDGSLSRVEFYNGATRLGQDATSPYTFTWSNVSAGSYSLVAKAIDNSGNSATDRVDITVNAVSGESCASTGSIRVETWTGIEGREISSIPLNSAPASVANLTTFETAANSGDHYGSRVRGYICVPATGNYTFWIASNDHGELWLSTDESPANKSKIAYVLGWTNPGQWDKYAAQRSAAVHLLSGRSYYIEALMKEGTGSDHMAVGWQLPGGALERPIPGRRLIPFQNSGNELPIVRMTSPDDGQSFTAPASINLIATASDSDGSISKVEFYNGATRLGQDATSPYTFTWTNVSAGNYSLVARATDNSGGSATDRIDITVSGESGGSCASTGSIQVETWTGIEGREISSIPLNSSPASVANLTTFETEANSGDHYGSRVRGYICVPATGNYTFWIASNDSGELWLSTDERPAYKSKIAYVQGWTSPGEWDKYAAQRSAAVHLVENRRYYIEALMKEGTGSDHLSVGWQLPGGAVERPIPGRRLIPFQNSGNELPTVRMTSPDDGQSFTAPASIDFIATASDSDGSVSKVEFYNGATKLGEDASSPYSFTWSDVSAGNYSLVAKAIDNSGSSATDRVDITVNAVSGGSCVSTGTIQVETWTGIEGKEISSIPLNSAPASVADLTIFETPTNTGDHYGSRVRGYICVPTTGNYTFWIASNDSGELWLSTDESPANKSKIAYVQGWTNPGQWDKYGAQRSVAVHLAEGRRYYIEALMKEGVGSDHLSVGWRLPGGALERPIPGSRLSKFETQAAARPYQPTETTQDATLYSHINIYPNPVERTDAQLTLGGYEGITETIQTQIEIINMTGEVVFAERIQCGGGCSDYLININRQLVPGVYIVNLKTNDARYSQRLFVK